MKRVFILFLQILIKFALINLLKILTLKVSYDEITDKLHIYNAAKFFHNFNQQTKEKQKIFLNKLNKTNKIYYKYYIKKLNIRVFNSYFKSLKTEFEKEINEKKDKIIALHLLLSKYNEKSESIEYGKKGEESSSYDFDSIKNFQKAKLEYNKIYQDTKNKVEKLRTEEAFYAKKQYEILKDINNIMHNGEINLKSQARQTNSYYKQFFVFKKNHTEFRDISSFMLFYEHQKGLLESYGKKIFTKLDKIKDKLTPYYRELQNIKSEEIKLLNDINKLIKNSKPGSNLLTFKDKNNSVINFFNQTKIYSKYAYYGLTNEEIKFNETQKTKPKKQLIATYYHFKSLYHFNKFYNDIISKVEGSKSSEFEELYQKSDKPKYELIETTENEIKKNIMELLKKIQLLETTTHFYLNKDLNIYDYYISMIHEMQRKLKDLSPYYVTKNISNQLNIEISTYKKRIILHRLANLLNTSKYSNTNILLDRGTTFKFKTKMYSLKPLLKFDPKNIDITTLNKNFNTAKLIFNDTSILSWIFLSEEGKPLTFKLRSPFSQIKKELSVYFKNTEEYENQTITTIKENLDDLKREQQINKEDLFDKKKYLIKRANYRIKAFLSKYCRTELFKTDTGFKVKIKDANVLISSYLNSNKKTFQDNAKKIAELSIAALRSFVSIKDSKHTFKGFTLNGNPLTPISSEDLKSKQSDDIQFCAAKFIMEIKSIYQEFQDTIDDILDEEFEEKNILIKKENLVQQLNELTETKKREAKKVAEEKVKSLDSLSKNELKQQILEGS